VPSVEDPPEYVSNILGWEFPVDSSEWFNKAACKLVNLTLPLLRDSSFYKYE